MQLKHPVVFLFGAGATRGAFGESRIPPPVDADFFAIAGQVTGRGTPSFARAVLKDVWALYRRTYGIGLEEYYRDIETRDRVGSFAGSGHRPKNWRKRRDVLEELIRRVAIQTTCDTDHVPFSPMPSGVHREILEELKPGDTILTFNYDTVIEESLPHTTPWSPVGGYGSNVSGYTHDWAKNWLATRGLDRSHVSRVQLLKLHGSLNWTEYSTNTVRIKPRPYVVRSGSRENVAILAPGWNKEIHRNPYRRLWKEARARLDDCETLVVVGYSLPDTDLLARALFAESVRQREKQKAFHLLKQLHVADPNELVTQKLINLFIPALGAQGKIFKYNGIAELAARLVKARLDL